MTFLNDTFPYRRLVQQGLEVPKDKYLVLGETEKVMFDLDTFESDLEHVNSENYPNMLLLPKDKKLALSTVDGFILPNMCFRIAKKGTNHAIDASTSLVELLEKIERFCRERNIPANQTESEENRFRYVLIVPDNQYRTLMIQPVEFKSDNDEPKMEVSDRENIVNIVNNKITQYVLKLQLD